ncbi:MAG: DUF3021 domain-containing protein [Lachnospiraceae bacterium]|nr:DUF3021 domain-containing protein [Lachnospiraceae bacterium]
MNKLAKKGLLLGGIGFVIGLLIGLGVWLASSGGHPVLSEISPFELIVGGIYGMLAMGGSVSYDVEHWSILRCTLTHLVPTFLGFYVMGFVHGWLIPGSALFWIMTVCWLVAYLIIWLSQYLIWRKKIKALNEELKKMKKR